MVDKSRRKELMDAYRERKPQVGVFAVTCSVSGEAWVGWSSSLDKRQNSIWTQLRSTRSATAPGPGRTIQEAWLRHGEAAFSYEVLETIEEDNEHTLKMRLDERARHWREKLNAGVLAGR
jgi:hypothetical protein